MSQRTNTTVQIPKIAALSIAMCILIPSHLFLERVSRTQIFYRLIFSCPRTHLNLTPQIKTLKSAFSLLVHSVSTTRLQNFKLQAASFFYRQPGKTSWYLQIYLVTSIEYIKNRRIRDNRNLELSIVTRTVIFADLEVILTNLCTKIPTHQDEKLMREKNNKEE